MSENLTEQSKVLKEIKELADEVYAKKLASDKAEKEYKEAKNKLVEVMVHAEVDKMQADTVTASVLRKSSVSVPKEHDKKKKVFDYIKNEYGESVLFDMLTINARSFSSWYTAEVEKQVQAGQFDWQLDEIKPHEYESLGLRKRNK
jgi:hypothetical protein